MTKEMTEKEKDAYRQGNFLDSSGCIEPFAMIVLLAIIAGLALLSKGC